MDELHELVMAEALARRRRRGPARVELLAALRAAGMPVGLAVELRRATFVRPRRSASAGLLDDGPFAAIVAGDEVAHPKPAPDLYLEACRRLGADAGGVRRAGGLAAPGVAAAAAAAGMFVIGVPYSRRASSSPRPTSGRLAGRRRGARRARPATRARLTRSSVMVARSTLASATSSTPSAQFFSSLAADPLARRCCSALLFFGIYLTLRSRAFFNVLRAAYPAERFQWRRIWGAYVAAVRLQQRRAGARRRRHQAVPDAPSIPGSSYSGDRARRSSSSSVFDAIDGRARC